MNLAARPTTYKGIPMRSRLEARFAAFLDDQGYSWTYEPRAYAGDGGQYLPDFQIAAKETWFVEVKPTIGAAYAAMRRMQVIWESEPNANLIVAVADGPHFFVTPEQDRVWRPARISGWTVL